MYFSRSCKWASLVPKMVKNVPAMQEISVQSLGQGAALEKTACTADPHQRPTDSPVLLTVG